MTARNMPIFGTRYLCQPPALVGDTRHPLWGAGIRNLDMPGGPYHLHGIPEAIAPALDHRFEKLYTDHTPAHGVRVDLRRVPASLFHDVQFTNEAYTFDRLGRADGIDIAGAGFAASIDLSSPSRITIWVAEASRVVGHAVLDNVLRVASAHAILARGGVLMHSAGVDFGDGVYVLYGHSGAGKSTAARRAQSAGATVLSDDLNAILPANGAWQVHRVPFSGALAQEARIEPPRPLRALLRLRQAPQPTLRPMSVAHATAAMIACTPSVNDDPWRQAALLEAVGALAAATPTHALDASLETPWWSLVENVHTRREAAHP